MSLPLLKPEAHIVLPSGDSEVIVMPPPGPVQSVKTLLPVEVASAVNFTDWVPMTLPSGGLITGNIEPPAMVTPPEGPEKLGGAVQLVLLYTSKAIFVESPLGGPGRFVVTRTCESVNVVVATPDAAPVAVTL